LKSESRPLAGLRVLDIGTYIAAPYCATLLAEFGAEVIKVELPKIGDPCRRLGSMTECGDSLVWLSEARNKKSITLDLRKREGADLLKRLAAVSDVVTENFQPGTLERWGVGYEDLEAVNQKLVMVRISGYGQTGPYRDKPGFGRIGNAFGGIAFLSGEPDRPPAIPGTATLSDYMSGLYAALGVLMALRYRDAPDAPDTIDGGGQYIDIGLYEPIFRILDELAPAYDKFGFVRERMGAATVNACPHSHYPSKDGRWIAIACTNDKMFERLANLMGRPELAGDGIYGTIEERDAARDEVDGIVTDWTRRHQQAEILALCDQAQVPCSIVAAIDEIFEDPHYRARENIVRVTSPRAGELAVPNVVPRLSATPGRIDSLGPALGEHNREVYGDLLGVDSAEIERLEQAEVI